MSEGDKFMNGGICVFDLRDIRRKLEYLRERKSAVAVEMSTFFYEHDQHIEEVISIWDSFTSQHYFTRTLKEASRIIELLKKGETNALTKYTNTHTE